MILGFGFVGIGVEHDPHARKVYERLQRARVNEFKRRGLEFTKGFLAAKLRNKPLLLAQLALNHGYLGEVAIAARIALQEMEVDPYTCGRDLYQGFPSGRQIRRSIVEENK